MTHKTCLASIITVGFFAIIFVGASAFQPEETYKNLKVLPKDISHEALGKEMHFYNQSLNVKCNYCHAADPARPGRLDFASDSNKMKDEAREMMILTNELNEKYFHTKPNTPQISNAVNCYTCHRGEEFPMATLPSDTARRKSGANGSVPPMFMAPPKQR
jgi:hypothetical protein